jgi:hypothetical protein
MVSLSNHEALSFYGLTLRQAQGEGLLGTKWRFGTTGVNVFLLSGR